MYVMYAVQAHLNMIDEMFTKFSNALFCTMLEHADQCTVYTSTYMVMQKQHWKDALIHVKQQDGA